MEEAHWVESRDERLFGILHRAEDARGTVLLLHGFTGDHIGPKYTFPHLARQLCEQGLNVFRFDYAGSGNSTGTFTDQTLDTAVKDAAQALSYIEEQGCDTGTLGLVGHSMGGSVALSLSQREDVSADSVALWSTVADYGEVFSSEQAEQLAQQEMLRLYGFDYPADHLQHLKKYDIEKMIATLDCPVLLAHGKKDYSVPFSHAEQLYEAAQEPKQLLALEQSDHIFMNPDEREQLLEETADWLTTHLR